MDETHAHHAGIRTYTIIYAWLVILMFATIAAWALNLGPLNILIALGIAIVKAVLVVMYFMHVKFEGRLVWVFSGAAFVWLAILLGLTLSDYVSRGMVPRRQPSTPTAQLFGSSQSQHPATQPTTRANAFD